MDTKHVWFDFGGTLYRETPEFIQTHDNFRYYTYAKLKDITDPEVSKDEFLKLYEKYGSNSAVFSSLGQPSNYWMKQLDKLDLASIMRPVPEVSQTLESLKNIVPVSIFTNFRKDRLLELLKHLRIPDSYFTYILSGDDVNERKPALDGFYEIIEKSRLPASQILYVGDRVDADISPAKKVGIKTCLLYSKSEEADVSLERFRDLLGLFKT